MARTIEEIKSELETKFMTTFRSRYGIASGVRFEEYFSKVSLENLWLYIHAWIIRAFELYVDDHEQQVAEYIATLKPHTLRWYVDMVKRYQHGLGTLDPEYGTYSNPEGTTDEQIAKAQVVKYASAMEDNATLYIKVAGENSRGWRVPISQSELAGLKAYVGVCKDAGVRVDIINVPAAWISFEGTIYYDPLVLDNMGRLLSDTSRYPVQEALKAYVENLPFDGVLRWDKIIETIQAAEGVAFVDRDDLDVWIDDGGDGASMTEAYVRPYSGYYEMDETVFTYVPYNP